MLSLLTLVVKFFNGDDNAGITTQLCHREDRERADASGLCTDHGFEQVIIPDIPLSFSAAPFDRSRLGPYSVAELITGKFISVYLGFSGHDLMGD